ncbi:DUF2971 domain-containing protein [Dysgonomonas sp.]|jgi:hypothetical protein|uniref:DUF2971 domain-containing protein n=1 Tax=Dysgonomonas sp. TaxID=1891233 RepID=UPI002826C656|nr:DUF2971 domain-containing protein [Dysgonomonas sp.]MDR2001683.1 DUF2971 domain-containing protein [Prevotella sp.]HMM04263.1 DUF2971 domain-containing protein [Dysgonomonas sp.]
MDNILMWSHYADNHKGVCLEWEIDEKSEEVKSRLMEIVYENDIITLNNIERTQDGFLSINISSNGRFLVRKLKVWDYEKELRTYCVCEDINKTGEPKEFLGNLTAIYFGKNTSQDNLDLIKHNTLHYQNLLYYKVGLDIQTMKNDKLLKI